MKATRFGAGWTAVILAMFVLTGCGGGATGPDSASDRTLSGIRVIGATEDRFASIDRTWAEVVNCWQTDMSGERVVVDVRTPEFYDKSGLGVIRVDGTLVYGLRFGNQVWVATDFAALRHEFSHIVGERATGRSVENGGGKCWL